MGFFSEISVTHDVVVVPCAVGKAFRKAAFETVRLQDVSVTGFELTESPAVFSGYICV